MLTLEQISNQFPLSMRQISPRGMLVEYLQYEVLDSLFKDAAAAALSFMWLGGQAFLIVVIFLARISRISRISWFGVRMRLRGLAT